MAVFTAGAVPWNSLDDNIRLPLTSEIEGGYPCGQADQQLFNFTAAYPWGQVHNVLTLTGTVVDRTNLTQLATAIQSGLLNYAATAGTASAITVTLPIAPTSLFSGLRVLARITTTNTASPTLNVNGLGAVAILTTGGAPLPAMSLRATSIAELVYNGTNWVAVAGTTSSATPRGSTIYSTSGAMSFTVPTDVYMITAEIWGAGGGGCNTGLQSGGAGGGYSRTRISVTPGQVLTGSVGAGGAAGTTQGVAGGTTTFGGMTAIGGSFGASTGGTSTGGSASGGELNMNGCGSVRGGGGPFGGTGGATGPEVGAFTVSGGFPGGGGSGANGATAGAGANGSIYIQW